MKTMVKKVIWMLTAEIFNEAVKGYEMLNATPVAVGSRQTKAGMEYCFEAETRVLTARR